uniref:Uncharacterized protein n=1 Tax=Macaca fascicularis TaxID=9541 RepID=A0A7N9CIK9_MACFA
VTWKLDQTLLSPTNWLQCRTLCIVKKKGCRVHVHNVQVCYICILVPCWCAAPINSSYPIEESITSV